MDETEDEDEEENYRLVPRVRAGIEVQRTTGQGGAKVALSRSDEPEPTRV